jgi:hypothetical protein
LNSWSIPPVTRRTSHENMLLMLHSNSLIYVYTRSYKMKRNLVHPLARWVGTKISRLQLTRVKISFIICNSKNISSSPPPPPPPPPSWEEPLTYTLHLWGIVVLPSSTYSQQVSRLFLFSLDHTQTHTAAGRTPLDEGSARRRDLYLTTQTLTRDKHPCPRLDSNPRSQQALGRRPMPQTARPICGT